MRKLALFASLAVLLSAVTAFAAADMVDYCQAPPTVSTAIPPNILLMVDGTGSMSTFAYTSSTYNPAIVYEGYFDPEQDYVQESNGSGIWVEKGDRACTKDCTITCQASNLVGTCGAKNANGCTGGKYPCCINTTMDYCPELDNGNHLNYLNMQRIDGIHWAMTGGTPSGCNGTVGRCDASQITKQPIYTGTTPATCYDDGSVVINGTPVSVPGGCILQANNGTRVRARWDRLTGNNGGLLYKLQGLPIQPRIGLMLFEGSGVVGNVLIGDFNPAGPPSYDAAHPYKNTITALNAKNPGGVTPTGPALRAAQAYFAQKPAVFGGPAPQTGTTDQWKNPLYQCNDKDNNGTCSGDELMLMSCAKNFIILLSDGEWNQPDSYTGSDPVTPAYEMHKLGMTNVPTGLPTIITTIYSIGLWLSPGAGERAMHHIAMYGGFDTASGQWPGGTTGLPNTSLTVTLPAAPPYYPDWNKNGRAASGYGIPDNYLSASSASEVKNQIANIILDLMKKASSGTAAAMLGSSGGSGAFAFQTLFYPKRSFNNNTEVAWTSDLMSYWYYMDPYFTNMQFHEDTVREGTDYTLLDLKQDYITSFIFDSVQDKVLAYRWEDASGKGSLKYAIDNTGARGTLPMETSRAVWRAGFNLWWTEPSARTVYTSLDGSTLTAFTAANSTPLADYLGQSPGKDANAIINYVRGSDCADATTGLACACGATNCEPIGRSRTVTTGVCSTPLPVPTGAYPGRRSPCDSAADCPGGETCVQETHVWKMGDITSSSPVPMGAGPLTTYNRQAPYGYNDLSYARFINSNDYKERQLVFSGSNDGMFHAFRLGKLLQNWPGKDKTKPWEVARLEGGTGPGGIGTEAYAFVPKNVLPYLQYLKNEDYCHVYMVDGPIKLTDVSINKNASCAEADYWDCPKITTMTAANDNHVDFADTSWRAVVIGSMGIGGATCNAATATSSRIKTPLEAGGPDAGWSSYFALDVTDQGTPQLLWEFAHPDLGVTNVGPAIIRTGEKAKNGRWFAVLASGSTGPIDNSEFKGISDKTLKLFILDLKTGELVRTIDTGIVNAFAGTMSSEAIDLERNWPGNSGNYQHDVLYIGYVQNVTQGGVIRLAINDDSNPANWSATPVFANGVLGPVTAPIAASFERRAGRLWLYFGEGRYFYKQDDLGAPGGPTLAPVRRKLFGVQDPCFDNTTKAIVSTLPTCGPLQLSALQDQTTPVPALTPGKLGWYIQLNPWNSTSGAERLVSTPAIDPQGGILFASFVPTADVCGIGGNSRLWLLDYASGGAVKYRLQGKILIQMSTGEVKEIDLSTAFLSGGAVTTNIPLGIGIANPPNRPITPPEPGFRGFVHIQEE